MRIFALETNRERLVQHVTSPGAKVLLCVCYHWVLFAVRFIVSMIVLALLIGADLLISEFIDLPILWVQAVFALPILLFVVIPIINAFIDWQFDCLILTSDELIVIDQTSIVKVKIRQMDLDNVASVAFESQFWNLLGFGKLVFELKEGTGKSLVLPYIPHADRVSSMISNAVSAHQNLRAGVGHTSPR